MMKRRDIGRGLLAFGAVGLLPVAAWAERDNPETDPLARVLLDTGTTTALISWVVIRAPGGPLALDLRQPALRYNENRMDLGRVPLIGELQRPLLARRFAGARPVGALHRAGPRLIVVPTGGADLGGKRVVIANRDQSWEPPGRTASETARRLPPPRRSETGGEVGTAYLKGGELLLLVRPSIVGPPV